MAQVKVWGLPIALAPLVAPWLNPFAPGPWPAAVPLMFSWFCATVALGVVCWRGLSGWLPDELEKLAFGPWLVAALVSSGLALLQFTGVSSHFQPWVNVTLLGEAFANLRQRNQFATLTNMGLLALVFWVQNRSRPALLGAGLARLPGAKPMGGSWGPRISGAMGVAVLLAAVLLAVGNAASSSRTGLVQILLVAVLAQWWGGASRARNVALAAVLAYGLASLLLPVLIGRELGSGGILNRLNDGGLACGSRLKLWGNVLHLISLKPWLGWGWGELDFAHFITLYPGDASGRFCEILDNAHNLPLHLAVELGLPVALAVCGAGIWLVWRAKPWREQSASRQMAWGVLAVIGLHSLLEYPLWYGPFQIAVGLCVWILWATAPEIGNRLQTSMAANPVPAAAKAGGEGGKGGGGGAGVRAQASQANTAKVTKEAKTTTNVVNQGSLGDLNAKYEQNSPLALEFIGFAAILIIATVSYASWDYHRISQIYLPVDQRDAAYRTDTLAKIQSSRLFKNQVRFAELTTTTLTPQNAANLNAMARDLLHFSPEARVAEKLIESSVMLRQDDEALFYLARYRAAFPAEHATWAKAQTPASATR